MCIYIHVPFCSSKCHSATATRSRFRPVTKTQEPVRAPALRRVGALGRPGKPRFAPRSPRCTSAGEHRPTWDLSCSPYSPNVAERCFNTSRYTEWALESTVDGLTPDMIDTMQMLGFNRLHIGVQSLEEPVRQVIGRRRPVADVLAIIHQTLRLGWIVSVDMVCGLPLQTIPSFKRDIDILLDTGVNGVSLYELLIYPQNLRWAKQQGLEGRSHLPNYLMFHVAAAALHANGYRKNTFNHWADKRDNNRYFTFPSRGEDCLAVGTIADGVFGDYHFRHPRYAAYIRSATPVSPGLEGGLRRTAAESKMHPVATAIISGRVPEGLIPLLRRQTDGTPLASRWVDLGLVAETDDGGLRLLTNGSWFAGNMIKEYTGLYPEYTAQH